MNDMKSRRVEDSYPTELIAMKRLRKHPPQWVTEGDAIGLTKQWKPIECWGCDRFIRGLAVVIRSKRGLELARFHRRCWRHEVKGHIQVAEIKDIYKTVEDAGQDGITLREAVFLSQVQRKFVSWYLNEMVRVKKFRVKQSGRQKRYYLPS